MAKRIIVDFDNTMGVPRRDTDDGFALFYLLGHPELASVQGLTCAYGNSDMETVYTNTCRIVEELGLELPVFKGGASAEESISDAARFLAESAAAAPGQIHLLATGSMTNLKGAAQLDPDFFGNLASITVMGGITESLVINGLIMNELNLSCDAGASTAMLGAACPVTVASAQACLPAVFTQELFAQEMGTDCWLMQECANWFDWMGEAYGMRAFICWDVVAAAALITPELFEMEPMQVTLNERLLRVGYLEHAAADAPQSTILIPRIKDPDALRAACFSAWQRAMDLL